MGRGIDRYNDKERRKARRSNHIARDLRTPKYNQRVVEGRPKPPPPEIEEYLDENDYNYKEEYKEPDDKEGTS